MSLSYIFRVISATVLVLSVLANASDWEPDAAKAAVVSEPKSTMPKGATQAVELLRFVTAYKKGVESFVDITPYSALLRASADTDGELTFYAFIDTWVGNNSQQTKPIMRVDGAGQCNPGTKTTEADGDGGRSGNGWQLDADLVFYPKVAAAVDTRPRESITLSSGYYGGYSIGGITAHEGIVAAGGDSIEIAGGVDLTGTLDAEVYPCPGGAKDVERGIKMGQVAQKLQSYGNETDSMNSVVEDVYKQLVGDSTTSLKVSSSDADSRHVEVTFDAAEMHLEPGMPVWYENEDIENGTSPSPDTIGTVVSAEAGKATIEITGACFPSESSSWLPRLKMEKSPGALAIARKAADSMKSVKQRMTGHPKENEDIDDHVSLLTRSRHVHQKASSSSDGSVFEPFLVGQGKDNAYGLLPILGQVDLGFLGKEGAECAPAMLSFLQTDEKEEPAPGSAEATAARLVGKAAASTEVAGGTQLVQMAAGDKVCILARRATGRVFERSFDMPTFVGAAAVGAAAAGNVANSGAAAGNVANSGSASHPAAAGSTDRVLLQFAVTGHGWSGSTEQCGEFCHAIYHIKVNGKSAANVTEWRADCEKNPVSGQFGTWEIHRDGWCPGTVEPGLYIDMTKYAKAGRNELSVDLSVWSSKTKRYERYTNYGNYLGGGDGASLFVGATMFVYDGSAVDAILGQGEAYTAAEAAIRDGSSVPSALQPPERVNSAFESSYLELGSETTALVSPASKSKRLLSHQKHHVRRKGWRSTPKVQKHSQHSKLQKHLVAQLAEEGDRFNFEARAPWYNYDEKADGVPGARVAGATVVPAFADKIIQLNSREVRVTVDKKSLPRDWAHAAVHFRLETPGLDGLSMDNWDRVGSLGLVFDEFKKTTTDPNSKVLLRPSAGRTKSSSMKLTRVATMPPAQAKL